MGIRRQLSRSNTQRQKALTAAKKRHDTLASPADNVLTGATLLRLNAIEPLYKAAMIGSGGKLASQLNITADTISEKTAARTYISHFFQSFNNGIERGLFKPGDRAYYQLDGNSGRVPDLDAESDILDWGFRIKVGDANRVADGGIAMAMPTAAEVDAKVTAFDTVNSTQGNKKLAFDQSQEQIDALNPEANNVIKKIWDEAETFYNEEPAPSMRRKCREWGVVYISDIPNLIHLLVVDVIDGHAIINVEVTLVESDEVFKTDINGKAEVKTNLDVSVTLHIEAEGYVSQDVVVEFADGVHDFPKTISLVHA